MAKKKKSNLWIWLLVGGGVLLLSGSGKEQVIGGGGSRLGAVGYGNQPYATGQTPLTYNINLPTGVFPNEIINSKKSGNRSIPEITSYLEATGIRYNEYGQGVSSSRPLNFLDVVKQQNVDRGIDITSLPTTKKEEKKDNTYNYGGGQGFSKA